MAGQASELERLFIRHANFSQRKGIGLQRLNEIFDVFSFDTLHAYVRIRKLMASADDIQRQETALDTSERVIESILQQGGILTQGRYSELSQLTSVSCTQPFLKTTVKDLSDAYMTTKVIQQAIRATSTESAVYIVQPGIDKQIRLGEKTKQGMTFRIGQQDISDIVGALEPLIREILGSDHPISVKTVIIQKLAELSRRNRDYADREKFLDRGSKRRTQATQLKTSSHPNSSVNLSGQSISLEQHVIPPTMPELDSLLDIEADSPDRRIYHGTLLRFGNGVAQLAPNPSPEPEYNTDYQEGGKGPVLVFGVSKEAFTQPLDTLRKREVIVRGELAAKVTKLEAYSVSTLPIQSEQDEQIIRLVKKFGLTPTQIASQLHLSVTEVEVQIAAINEIFQRLTNQTERKFLY